MIIMILNVCKMIYFPHIFFNLNKLIASFISVNMLISKPIQSHPRFSGLCVKPNYHHHSNLMRKLNIFYQNMRKEKKRKPHPWIM